MNAEHALDKLTSKQLETVRLLARGHTSKEIAALTGVSGSAINHRVECMLKNIGIADRRELIRWYQDVCSRCTGEPFPVVGTGEAAALSRSDQTASTLDRADPGRHEPRTDPQVFLLSIPEAPTKAVDMAPGRWRNALETVFFGVLAAAGIVNVLARTLA